MGYVKIYSLIVLILAGCDTSVTEPLYSHDQCLRREIFNQCLANVPKGPQATVRDSWASVVDECDSAANHISYRLTSQVKVECRS